MVVVPEPGTAAALPLSDVRVLDLSQFEAGPSCTQMLAWFGAEVIKVEKPGTGEQGRAASRDNADWDSIYFLMLNCNKKSITLDLKSETGRDLLLRLVEQSDVVIENYGPGVMERLGLTWEILRERNPRLVYTRIQGFGSDTRFADYLSFDPIAQAVGGATAITGESMERPPVRPGPTLADTGGGLHAALGILVALHDRAKTGRGHRIELALQEGVINFCRAAFVQQAMLGRPSPRTGGTVMPNMNAPVGLHPCAPGGPNDWVQIYAARGPRGNQHWNRLLKVIGREDLIGDPRFDSPESRGKYSAEVTEIVSTWTQTVTKHEAMVLLGEAGVPAGAVADTEELMNDPDLVRRGVFVTVDHPHRGDFVVPGCPVRLSDVDVAVRPAPLLGADSEQVLQDVLGMDEQQIESLRKTGVV